MTPYSPACSPLLSRHQTRADLAESQAALERWFAPLAEVPAHGHERDATVPEARATAAWESPHRVMPAEAAPATLALSGSRP